MSDVSFITDHVAYSSTNKTNIVSIETELLLFFTLGECVSCLRGCTLGYFHSRISTQTFRRALTASVDSCAEIKNAPFSGVTKSGRVWRKVPETDHARSVGLDNKDLARTVNL